MAISIVFTRDVIGNNPNKEKTLKTFKPIFYGDKWKEEFGEIYDNCGLLLQKEIKIETKEVKLFIITNMIQSVFLCCFIPTREKMYSRSNDETFEWLLEMKDDMGLNTSEESALILREIIDSSKLEIGIIGIIDQLMPEECITDSHKIVNKPLIELLKNLPEAEKN